ncbi:MAG: DUF1214 domain-containing protein [Sphingomonadales bacterium]|nr:DUF1214 domain-containing protein [Sphingomonadales bacterium]
MAFGASPEDPALAAAWDRFCDRLKDAGRLAFKDAVPANPLQRADAFRFLTQNLGQAFPLALETADPAWPMIHWFTHPTMKLGGDVADFTYRQAWISGQYRYRLTGKRGTARFFNVTVQGPKPALMANGNPPLHEPFGDVPEANLFGHQLVTDADGSFEVLIGGEQAGPNWLPLTAGSRKLFIREGFDSWDETPTPLTIERIGQCTVEFPGPRPLPTPQRMIEAMQWAGDFATGLMRDWPEHSWANSGGVCDPTRLNEFPGASANSAEDAKRGRMAAHMIWKLAPDEALIVEMDAHDGFWIFGMGGALVGSLDFLTRPVSATPARTAVDEDGVVRLVLAHEDPGVANWLDTQGFAEGNLTYRNLLSQQGAAIRTRLVKAANLPAELPPTTRRVTPAEREAERLRRYHSVKRRFGI